MTSHAIVFSAPGAVPPENPSNPEKKKLGIAGADMSETGMNRVNMKASSALTPALAPAQAGNGQPQGGEGAATPAKAEGDPGKYNNEIAYKRYFEKQIGLSGGRTLSGMDRKSGAYYKHGPAKGMSKGQAYENMRGAFDKLSEAEKQQMYIQGRDAPAEAQGGDGNQAAEQAAQAGAENPAVH